MPKNNYICRFIMLLLVLSVASQVQAIPFPEFDARSAAMGGANIAQGIRNAAFYNPALAALESDQYDWYLVLPGSGDVISDPDNVKDGVRDIVNGTGNTAQIISDINNSNYIKYNYNVAQLTIPTPFLGGAAYIAKYDHQTENVNTDLSGTYLNHRALNVFETGVSVAQLQDVLWFNNVLVGVTAKMLLIESYGYQEPIASADFNLDNSQVKRNSLLNLDFGLSKEYGVWKTGLVIKNLFTQKKKFGQSDDHYYFAPLVKAAFAYQSRRNVFEVDLDLTKNSGIGYEPDTRYAAMGWEWSPVRFFSLRLGYQQNLVEDRLARFSAGLGFKMWGLLLDVSASADADNRGTFLQASWEL